jgi:hypothetical protein
MRRSLTCMVALALICLEPLAHAQPQRLTGKFTGTGRACSGRVVVRAKTISWISSFSRCEALPYERIEQTGEAGVVRYSFRFTRNLPGCLYRYITISHHEPEGADVGWEIIGYGSERSYLADKAGGYKAEGEDALSCYLIRVSK